MDFPQEDSTLLSSDRHQRLTNKYSVDFQSTQPLKPSKKKASSKKPVFKIKEKPSLASRFNENEYDRRLLDNHDDTSGEGLTRKVSNARSGDRYHDHSNDQTLIARGVTMPLSSLKQGGNSFEQSLDVTDAGSPQRRDSLKKRRLYATQINPAMQVTTKQPAAGGNREDIEGGRPSDADALMKNYQVKKQKRNIMLSSSQRQGAASGLRESTGSRNRLSDGSELKKPNQDIDIAIKSKPAKPNQVKSKSYRPQVSDQLKANAASKYNRFRPQHELSRPAEAFAALSQSKSTSVNLSLQGVAAEKKSRNQIPRLQFHQAFNTASVRTVSDQKMNPALYKGNWNIQISRAGKEKPFLPNLAGSSSSLEIVKQKSKGTIVGPSILGNTESSLMVKSTARREGSSKLDSSLPDRHTALSKLSAPGGEKKSLALKRMLEGKDTSFILEDNSVDTEITKLPSYLKTNNQSVLTSHVVSQQKPPSSKRLGQIPAEQEGTERAESCSGEQESFTAPLKQQSFKMEVTRRIPQKPDSKQKSKKPKAAKVIKTHDSLLDTTQQSIQGGSLLTNFQERQANAETVKPWQLTKNLFDKQTHGYLKDVVSAQAMNLQLHKNIEQAVLAHTKSHDSLLSDHPSMRLLEAKTFLDSAERGQFKPQEPDILYDHLKFKKNSNFEQDVIKRQVLEGKQQRRSSKWVGTIVEQALVEHETINAYNSAGRNVEITVTSSAVTSRRGSKLLNIHDQSRPLSFENSRKSILSKKSANQQGASLNSTFRSNRRGRKKEEQTSETRIGDEEELTKKSARKSDLRTTTTRVYIKDATQGSFPEIQTQVMTREELADFEAKPKKGLWNQFITTKKPQGTFKKEKVYPQFQRSTTEEFRKQLSSRWRKDQEKFNQTLRQTEKLNRSLEVLGQQDSKSFLRSRQLGEASSTERSQKILQTLVNGGDSTARSKVKKGPVDSLGEQRKPGSKLSHASQVREMANSQLEEAFPLKSDLLQANKYSKLTDPGESHRMMKQLDEILLEENMSPSKKVLYISPIKKKRYMLQQFALEALAQKQLQQQKQKESQPKPSQIKSKQKLALSQQVSYAHSSQRHFFSKHVSTRGGIETKQFSLDKNSRQESRNSKASKLRTSSESRMSRKLASRQTAKDQQNKDLEKELGKDSTLAEEAKDSVNGAGQEDDYNRFSSLDHILLNKDDSTQKSEGSLVTGVIGKKNGAQAILTEPEPEWMDIDHRADLRLFQFQQELDFKQRQQDDVLSAFLKDIKEEYFGNKPGLSNMQTRDQIEDYLISQELKHCKKIDEKVRTGKIKRDTVMTGRAPTDLDIKLRKMQKQLQVQEAADGVKVLEKPQGMTDHKGNFISFTGHKIDDYALVDQKKDNIELIQDLLHKGIKLEFDQVKKKIKNRQLALLAKFAPEKLPEKLVEEHSTIRTETSSERSNEEGVSEARTFDINDIRRRFSNRLYIGQFNNILKTSLDQYGLRQNEIMALKSIIESQAGEDETNSSAVDSQLLALTRLIPSRRPSLLKNMNNEPTSPLLLKNKTKRIDSPTQSDDPEPETASFQGGPTSGEAIGWVDSFKEMILEQRLRTAPALFDYLNSVPLQERIEFPPSLVIDERFELGKFLGTRREKSNPEFQFITVDIPLSDNKLAETLARSVNREKLLSLKLSSTEILEASARELIILLEDNAMIRELSLKYSKIKPRHIAQLLSTLCRFEIIESEDPLTATYGKSSFQASFNKTPSLLSPDPTSPAKTNQMLKREGSLLSLQSTKQPSLTFISNLQFLEISGLKLQKQGLLILPFLQNTKNLLKLDLSFNQFHSTISEQILLSVSKCPTIQHLSMAHNSLNSDLCLQTIKEMVRFSWTLLELDLSFTSIPNPFELLEHINKYSLSLQAVHYDGLLTTSKEIAKARQALGIEVGQYGNGQICRRDPNFFDNSLKVLVSNDSHQKLPLKRMSASYHSKSPKRRQDSPRHKCSKGTGISSSNCEPPRYGSNPRKAQTSLDANGTSQKFIFQRAIGHKELSIFQFMESVSQMSRFLYEFHKEKVLQYYLEYGPQPVWVEKDQCIGCDNERYCVILYYDTEGKSPTVDSSIESFDKPLSHQESLQFQKKEPVIEIGGNRCKMVNAKDMCCILGQQKVASNSTWISYLSSQLDQYHPQYVFYDDQEEEQGDMLSQADDQSESDSLIDKEQSSSQVSNKRKKQMIEIENTDQDLVETGQDFGNQKAFSLVHRPCASFKNSPRKPKKPLKKILDDVKNWYIYINFFPVQEKQRAKIQILNADQQQEEALRRLSSGGALSHITVTSGRINTPQSNQKPSKHRVRTKILSFIPQPLPRGAKCPRSLEVLNPYRLTTKDLLIKMTMNKQPMMGKLKSQLSRLDRDSERAVEKSISAWQSNLSRKKVSSRDDSAAGRKIKKQQSLILTSMPQEQELLTHKFDLNQYLAEDVDFIPETAEEDLALASSSIGGTEALPLVLKLCKVLKNQNIFKIISQDHQGLAFIQHQKKKRQLRHFEQIMKTELKRSCIPLMAEYLHISVERMTEVVEFSTEALLQEMEAGGDHQSQPGEKTTKASGQSKAEPLQIKATIAQVLCQTYSFLQHKTAEALEGYQDEASSTSGEKIRWPFVSYIEFERFLLFDLQIPTTKGLIRSVASRVYNKRNQRAESELSYYSYNSNATNYQKMVDEGSLKAWAINRQQYIDLVFLTGLQIKQSLAQSHLPSNHISKIPYFLEKFVIPGWSRPNFDKHLSCLNEQFDLANFRHQHLLTASLDYLLQQVISEGDLEQGFKVGGVRHSLTYLSFIESIFKKLSCFDITKSHASITSIVDWVKALWGESHQLEDHQIIRHIRLSKRMVIDQFVMAQYSPNYAQQNKQYAQQYNRLFKDPHYPVGFTENSLDLQEFIEFLLRISKDLVHPRHLPTSYYALNPLDQWANFRDLQKLLLMIANSPSS